MTRGYGQYCPIAGALDAVGERWSLLVVRELLDGPLRYTDILERLGCGTNILAARLRSLEEHGIVLRRRLAPPAASTVYELTDAGVSLQPVLNALCQWGLRRLGPPAPDAEFVPGWLPRAMRSLASCADPSLRITIRCAGEVASAVGGVGVTGEIPDPDAVVTCEPPGLYALLVEGDASAVVIEGDEQAVARLVASFEEPVPVA